MTASYIANRYHLHELLGAGGMGTVYRGTDIQTNSVVAIKHLKPELTHDDMIERFIREGKALRDLNHPNIVKMLDEVEENGDHYLIMEYYPGGDLHDLVQQGALSVEHCLKLAIEIADALTRAHHLNIIHRDLKPANILLAEDDTPHLTDFGVAHIAKKDRITDTDDIVGTVDYLAPEILRGEGFDSRVDIWAFGVMLFEMLAGRRPFVGESMGQVLMGIITGPVPDLEALCPDAPLALVDLIYRMLEKDRDARVRSVRHVGALLEDILHGRTDDTPPPTRFAAPLPAVFERPKHNLPAQTTPFVGREAELAELAKLLDDSAIRLITVLAPGGMGKTRLALEVASHYVEEGLRPSPTPDLFNGGVYFVELAPLSDPANMVSAIAEATGYQFQGDGREPQQQILDFLRNKNLLLVLDNFEHLLDGVGLVTDILQAAPQVQILATSRQRLSQPGETLFHLAGMDFPEWETPEDALEYAAVKLFMNSAKRARPAFELQEHNLNHVARICRLVQGMPLGIVLAASWLAMLSPKEIANEIQQSLDFLADEIGQVPERQRSIRVVMDDTWQRMSEAEQQVFMKLSVFRGGFTREAAQAVAGANLRTLMSLMNKSLLRRDVDSGRYEIHELLRQYAEEYLISMGELDQIRLKHAQWFAHFVETQIDERVWFTHVHSAQMIIDEYANLRVAWLYIVEHDELDLFVAKPERYIGALTHIKGLAEGEKQFEKFVEILQYSNHPKRDYAMGCTYSGLALFTLATDIDKAIRYAESAVELLDQYPESVITQWARHRLVQSYARLKDFENALLQSIEKYVIWRRKTTCTTIGYCTPMYLIMNFIEAQKITKKRFRVREKRLR